jgi:uncharacterized cupredoxin-like copper-binding protein
VPRWSVRVRPGEDVVLRSQPPDLGVGGLLVGLTGADDAFDVLQLRAADDLAPSPALPSVLAEAPGLTVGEDAPRRTFVLEDNEINGTTMEPGRVDQVMPTGTTERWAVRNDGGMPHSFHLHGTSFRVHRTDGGEPAERLRGWKDTVLVPPGGSVELLVRFEGPGDPDTPYMFHCHLLSHHDQGMMGQLLVLDPGQEAATSPPPRRRRRRGAQAARGRPCRRGGERERGVPERGRRAPAPLMSGAAPAAQSSELVDEPQASSPSGRAAPARRGRRGWPPAPAARSGRRSGATTVPARPRVSTTPAASSSR